MCAAKALDTRPSSRCSHIRRLIRSPKIHCTQVTLRAVPLIFRAPVPPHTSKEDLRACFVVCNGPDSVGSPSSSRCWRPRCSRRSSCRVPGAGRPPPAGSGPLGVYVGYQSPGGVSSFGRAVGQQPTFAMDFLDGDSWSALVNTAPAYMSAWKGSGYTMIWGLPMLPNSGSTLAQGASGAYNSYFLQLAQEMVAGGQGSSIVRPGWEFNGGWFSWAANGQASAFVTFWQQIVNTMRSVPGQNFTFEWNPTAGDTGVGNLASTTPGTPTSTRSASISTTSIGGRTPALRRSGTPTSPSPTASTGWRPSPPRRASRSRCPSGASTPIPRPTTAESSRATGRWEEATTPPSSTTWRSGSPRISVYEATYWQYNSSLLSSRSNPNSFAAFVQDFGSGSGTSSGQGSTSTTSPSTTTTTSSSGSSAGSGSSGSGPSLGQTFPGSGQAGSSVTIQSPSGPVSTWQGAHFSAVVGSNSDREVPRPTGRSPGGSGAAPASRSRVAPGAASSVARNRTSHCNVGAGVLTAGDGPYTVSVTYPGGSGVAASSASVSQPVAKGNSRIILRTRSFVPVGRSRRR